MQANEPDLRLEMLRQAERHRAAGEHDAALELLDRVIALDPAWPGGHFFRGSMLLELDRLPEAEASLRSTIRLDPDDDVVARNLLAKVRYGQGDEAEAEAILGELLQRRLEPLAEVSVRSDLARLFARSNRPDAALSQIDPALEIAEHEGIPGLTAGVPTLLHMRGIVLFELGRLREAARTMERLVALRPDNARDWYNLAATRSRLERAADALDALRQAIRLDPDSGARARDDQDFEYLRTHCAAELEETISGALPTHRRTEQDEEEELLAELLQQRRIFVSYRRADGSAVAPVLKRAIEAQEPTARVFVDTENLEPVKKFTDQLSDAIQHAELVIVLIGPYWHTDEGRRRINDPEDIVRREITAALRGRVAVVPVLLDTDRMPPAESLPDDIRELTTIHALRVRSTGMQSDLEQVVATVRRLLGDRANMLHEVVTSPDSGGARLEYIGPPLPPVYRVSSSSGRGVPHPNIEQWYGIWECRAATPQVEYVVRFEPDGKRPGIFTGSFAEHHARSRRTESAIQGNWGTVVADDTHLIVGVYLDFTMGAATRKLILPFHQQVGDAYVGTDDDGLEYVTRAIRPGRRGF
jgi:tetratricopeptide (TPR) repeat protein